MAAEALAFEIDDAKGVEGNIEALKSMLVELHPILGARLGAFLHQITDDPGGANGAMWNDLRALLNASLTDAAGDEQ